ncbi:cross-pathway control protein 1 [Cordyceps fumosorosea ARSEF 2679]|uniref:Cross-pathway control protein 1 n=1 Tax=Cordyceps fumosorosea (strain ARSEF 2679) TaxID=1081104 RepID=A0A162MP52_CORFA|nr:cross-pathway control protein 1 [Cordyceps fumosorosea ARSEF 2679]OAA64790.1 cross-pathway control protein 1 [Cordyceps fumosorosea ARSEF 2679]
MSVSSGDDTSVEKDVSWEGEEIGRREKLSFEQYLSTFVQDIEPRQSFASNVCQAVRSGRPLSLITDRISPFDKPNAWVNKKIEDASPAIRKIKEEGRARALARAESRQEEVHRRVDEAAGRILIALDKGHSPVSVDDMAYMRMQPRAFGFVRYVVKDEAKWARRGDSALEAVVDLGLTLYLDTIWHLLHVWWAFMRFGNWGALDRCHLPAGKIAEAAFMVVEEAEPKRIGSLKRQQKQHSYVVSLEAIDDVAGRESKTMPRDAPCGYSCCMQSHAMPCHAMPCYAGAAARREGIGVLMGRAGAVPLPVPGQGRGGRRLRLRPGLNGTGSISIHSASGRLQDAINYLFSESSPSEPVKIQSHDINNIYSTQSSSPRSAHLLVDLNFSPALNSISSSSLTTANISSQDFPVFTTDSQPPWLPQSASALPAPPEHTPHLSPAQSPQQDFVLFDNPPPRNANRSSVSLSSQRRHSSYNNRLEKSPATGLQNPRVVQLLQSFGNPSYPVNANRVSNNNQFYASSAPSSTVSLKQRSSSARPPVPLFNQNVGDVEQPGTMMNAADVVLDDLPIFDGEVVNSAFSSPAIPSSFDFSGSISSSTSNLGTVSPHDLLVQEPFMSAPNSAALTALTSPSIYNESPDFDGYDVSPNFETADFGNPSDSWYPLFPQESSAPEAGNPEDSPNQASDSDSAGQASGNSRRKPSGSPTSGGRHAAAAGVNARKRDKPLPPIVVDDPNDVVAMKRARNTLAARKSRERKALRFDELEDKIAKLEAERDHWKKIALSQSGAR